MKCHDVYWEISIGYAVFKAAVSRRFSKPVYHFQVWSGGIVVLLAGVFSAVAPVAAQTALTYSFSPQVIPEKYTQPIRLEVAVLQRPTRGMIDFSPAATTPMNIDLHDDGLAGDRTANDGVYTVLLPVEPILRALRSDDVQRVFVGHLNLFNDAAHVSPINLFVDIYSPQVGTYAVSRLSNKVQVTSHLVNIWDESFFSTFDAAQVTREFYRLFGDDYDFLNIVSMPSRVANRDHLQVRNDVQGIGAGHIDRTGTYGSKGRLLGITRFPAGCLFDGATVGYVHELGHQWINYLNLPLLRSASPHWPFSSMAGGIMGFSIGGRGGEGGNFPCQVVERNGAIVLEPRNDGPKFSDLDLYLMGLLSAEQAHEEFVFSDQEAARSLPGHCHGQTYTGDVIRLRIQDIISREGPRKPAAGQAPTHFRIATILVTRDGLAGDETMWLYSWMAARAELQSSTATHEGLVKQMSSPFFLATGGRATLDTFLKLPN